MRRPQAAFEAWGTFPCPAWGIPVRGCRRVLITMKLLHLASQRVSGCSNLVPRVDMRPLLALWVNDSKPRALVAAVRAVLPSDQTEIPTEAPVPVLPSAIRISQPDAGAGGLAQPLPEPED